VSSYKIIPRTNSESCASPETQYINTHKHINARPLAWCESFKINWACRKSLSSLGILVRRRLCGIKQNGCGKRLIMLKWRCARVFFFIMNSRAETFQCDTFGRFWDTNKHQFTKLAILMKLFGQLQTLRIHLRCYCQMGLDIIPDCAISIYWFSFCTLRLIFFVWNIQLFYCSIFIWENRKIVILRLFVIVPSRFSLLHLTRFSEQLHIYISAHS